MVSVSHCLLYISIIFLFFLESKSEDVPKPKKPRKETKEEAKERRHREKLEQREKFFNWVKEKEAEDNNRCQIT